MKIVSTLDQIAEAVFTAKTLQAAQDVAIEHLEKSQIKATDKVKMMTEISNMKTLQKLQYYCANALLKYEGLGVGAKPTSAPVVENEQQ